MAWEGVTDGTLVLAARVHRRDELQYEGMWTDSLSGATHSVTEMITQWTSDMVIKSLPLFDLTTLSGGIGSAGMMAAIGAMGEGLERERRSHPRAGVFMGRLMRAQANLPRGQSDALS